MAPHRSDLPYARVYRKVWNDPAFRSWSSDAQLLFLYLLTNEHGTTEGLYRLPKAYVAHDLGWSPKRLAEPFGELLAAGSVQYDDDAEVVLIMKALEYQQPENPNQAIAAARKVAALPPTPLTSTFVLLAQRLCQRLADQLPELLPEPLAQPPSPSPSPTLAQTTPLVSPERSTDVVRQVSPPATTDDTRTVFHEWVVVTGRTERTVLDQKRRALIKKALRDYPLPDVLDAVRGWRNSPWHRGENPEGRAYNDLGLLLRDGGRIEAFRDLERCPPGVPIPKKLQGIVDWLKESA